MSWATQVKRIEAAHRRQEREAVRRQRELQRRAKEHAKLTALEQARLEVEEHENIIELLLSIHKDQSAPVDWKRIACSLSPHWPPRLTRNETRALFNSFLGRADQRAVADARELDDKAWEAARSLYATEHSEWDRERSFALQVLAGDPKAYTAALAEFSSITEIATLGTSIHMTVHSPLLVACELKVNPRSVVPAETKTLTASGKLSVKQMPRGRAQEVYQDYVCGCVLRLGREMLALLPIDIVLVTAVVDGTDNRTGQPALVPILSVCVRREEVAKLNFDQLDPSDAMDNFLHRGDVRTSRKSEGYVAIAPLTPDDLPRSATRNDGIADLVHQIRAARAELLPLLKSDDAAVEPQTAVMQ